MVFSPSYLPASISSLFFPLLSSFHSFLPLLLSPKDPLSELLPQTSDHQEIYGYFSTSFLTIEFSLYNSPFLLYASCQKHYPTFGNCWLHNLESSVLFVVSSDFVILCHNNESPGARFYVASAQHLLYCSCITDKGEAIAITEKGL